ncbi:uncharacterized protein E0L32_007455 [Thyridium curvatum]|uniref:Rhodopsin domain-containing protein n=1 Tax=Thyridium curvatum TaxID=1093900 RepID=A0A507AWV0_9PEZI|nr:uncharacterized protein E0L32_007455 [Thyridium curvatum]TPX11957.1 hypothetical protein E0L32_007455 [Thyridium curvatum]
MAGAGSSNIPGYRPPSDESRSEDIVAIVASLTLLSMLALVLRVWTRLAIQRVALRADDWTILASWAFSVAFTINAGFQTKYGLGQHRLDLPKGSTRYASWLELFFFSQATHYVTVSLAKISILLHYLDFTRARSLELITYAMAIFVGLTGLATAIASIFQCTPVQKAWINSMPGTCIKQEALSLANAGLNIAQDFIVYLLTVRLLWTVQMPKAQRIALLIVFLLGGFVCVTGILCLDSIKQAFNSKDTTWNNHDVVVWSSVGANLAIVCASLAHLKDLVEHFAPGLLGHWRFTRLPGGAYYHDVDSVDRPGMMRSFDPVKDRVPVTLAREIGPGESDGSLMAGSDAGQPERGNSSGNSDAYSANQEDYTAYRITDRGLV